MVESLTHQLSQQTFGGWVAERASRDVIAEPSSLDAAAKNRYIPIQLSRNYRRLAKQADGHRRDELLRAFDNLEMAVLASTSRKKIEGLQQLLVALIGDQGDGILASAAMREAEKASTSVLDVAKQKAGAAYRHYVEQTGVVIDERILEIIGLFQEVHAIDQQLFDVVKGAMPPGMAFLGADVNFWTANPDGSWNQQLKLERLGRELTDAEFLRFAEGLKEYYCHPKNNIVKVLWDIGVVALNGGLHEFHDQIEVIAQPLDEWLFWQFMLDAQEKGQIYSYNAHFALIECLVAHDKIKSIATLSNEEQRLGLKIADKRMTPCAADLAVIQSAISGNRPPRIPV